MDGVLNLDFVDFMILHKLYPQVFLMKFDEFNAPNVYFKDEMSPKSSTTVNKQKGKDNTQN